MRILIAIVLVVAAMSFVVSNAIGQTYIPLVASGPATSTPTFIPPPTDAPLATDTSVPTLTPTFTPTPTETSVEVSTQTPTQTPTQTSTPTATSTDVAVGITVLDNHSTYVDSIDYLNIIGEVRNDTNEKAQFVKVTANLFSSQDQLVDTKFTYITLDTLMPSQTTCFRISFSGNPQWGHYSFETSYLEASRTPLSIATFGDSGSQDSTFDNWYNVIGQARNDNSVNAEYVKIIGTLYRSDGKVVGCGYTYTNTDVLTPGQVSTWKINFLYAPPGTVNSYQLQAEGREE